MQNATINSYSADISDGAGYNWVTGRVSRSMFVVMANCVLWHCPPPIAVIVNTKYFTNSITVISEGQCNAVTCN